MLRIAHYVALTSIGSLLLMSAVRGQEGLIAIDGEADPQGIPVAVALYHTFGIVAALNEENSGRGKGLLRSFGITDEAEAEALITYMRAAWQAGRASSAQRKREFCAQDIQTLSELAEAFVARDRRHNKELERLVAEASTIVSAFSYIKLMEYGEQSRSNLNMVKFDPAAYYAANSNLDVAAEMQRLCD